VLRVPAPDLGASWSLPSRRCVSPWSSWSSLLVALAPV